MKSVLELQSDLEIYQRELDKCLDQAKSYRELIKKTRDNLREQEKAEAELLNPVNDQE
jgi:predicted ATP-grasp superfamily ATP-dependent carboligase